MSRNLTSAVLFIAVLGCEKPGPAPSPVLTIDAADTALVTSDTSESPPDGSGDGAQLDAAGPDADKACDNFSASTPTGESNVLLTFPSGTVQIVGAFPEFLETTYGKPRPSPNQTSAMVLAATTTDTIRKSVSAAGAKVDKLGIPRQYVASFDSSAGGIFLLASPSSPNTPDMKYASTVYRFKEDGTTDWVLPLWESVHDSPIVQYPRIRATASKVHVCGWGTGKPLPVADVPQGKFDGAGPFFIGWWVLDAATGKVDSVAALAHGDKMILQSCVATSGAAFAIVKPEFAEKTEAWPKPAALIKWDPCGTRWTVPLDSFESNVVARSFAGTVLAAVAKSSGLELHEWVMATGAESTLAALGSSCQAGWSYVDLVPMSDGRVWLIVRASDKACTLTPSNAAPISVPAGGTAILEFGAGGEYAKAATCIPGAGSSCRVLPIGVVAGETWMQMTTTGPATFAGSSVTAAGAYVLRVPGKPAAP
jgi:hypothetical protein